MSYVLKHKETGEIYSCTLKNIYDFAYHGVKVWEDQTAAAGEFASLVAEAGYDQPWLWEVVPIEENKLKLCNVKLNNNPARRIYWLPDGRLEARTEA
ncbi:MAG: hypothetical protein K0R57_4270 [Paenibacillaceae bacterium]|jgi:hypothetical protein|nr:hypothetical protein [Paenibacillaceae bacterium]